MENIKGMGMEKSEISTDDYVLLASFLDLLRRVLWRRDKPCCQGTGEEETNRSLDRGNGETDPLAGTPHCLERSTSEWRREVV